MTGIAVLGSFAILVILGMNIGCLLSSAHSFDDSEDNANDIQVVFPERLQSRRSRRDISSEAENTNSYDEERFRVEAFGRSLILDVIRNEVMIPEDFVIRSFNEDGQEIVKKSTGKGCHFQGHVEGHPESSVMLDTCDGIRGIIEDESESFSIMPFKAKGFNAHQIKRTRRPTTADPFQDFSCGTTNSSKDGAREYSRDRRRRSLAVDPLFRAHIPVNETRYAELIIIVDKVIYEMYGRNTSDMQSRIFDLVNAIDMIYQKINIRIILKALEIWTQKDLVKFNDKAGEDLNNLQKYREKHKDKYECDVLQLLRGTEWLDHGGMAYMREMCTIRSTGVVGWNKWSVVGPWIALAHEMGHNFGFDHDDLKKCKCLTPRGCIMRTFKTRVPGFSDCNLRDLQKIDDRCLYNIPVKNVNPARCGNGIKEGDEECDCGTKENCAIMDPCCNPKTCRLYSSSQCSNQHDKCCKDCQYAPTGSVCRKSKGQCDVPEFCTGKSGKCPPNDHKIDGTACHFYDFELVGNNADSNIKMSRLPRRIRARYVRINPQYWKKHICMRAEIYGCNQVRKNAPTLLRSDNNLYVDADNGLCDAIDVSELVFKPLDQGNNRNMQFKMTRDGTLIHQCTGNKVCPKNSPAMFGTRLVVSKRCSTQSAKFKRKGKSLMHVESGFCVHPLNGLAQDGIPLVLWKGCKAKSNIALTFVKADCEIALGMESGGIRNYRIKATSFRANKEAYHGRLNGFNTWCAGRADKKQHLQIDLGKAMLVSAVGTEGLYDGTRVTGYKLYYSTNGQQWRAYTGKTHSQLKNSYCYRGKCYSTRNSQCRDLWGPASVSASKACYNKFNTENTGYGTCHTARIKPCRPKDAMCGQLQCSDKTKKNPTVSYGVFYKKRLLAGKECSLVSRNMTRGDDLGMVKHGTKCGINKMCVNYKCRSISSLVRRSCPQINGRVCAGNGFCTALGKCHCKNGYDPLSNCASVTVTSVVDGGWGSWSSWSTCNLICGGGTQERYRLCDDPAPSLKGMRCSGQRIQTRVCNLERCPVAHSCRHLQAIGEQRGVKYPSGVYTINPSRQVRIKTYCDMTRDGGGWTLLVTSHTNTWTSSSLRRTENKPALDQDFSILFAANVIKDATWVVGSSFEYRIEAQEFGRWGGVWKAPRSYSFTATNNKQTNVKLIKKFDKWVYENLGIEKRMPWIHGAMLTTSKNATNHEYAYGTITSNIKKFYPAPWIYAVDSEKHPVNIWYWMREGEIREPKTCMELQLLSLQSRPLSSGIHNLKLRGKDFKTYCDFTKDGGGWTLLVTSTSRNGWTRKTVLNRNVKTPSLNKDFSILGCSDDIIGQGHFQYKIEDDTSQWGGIFEAQKGQSFLSGLSNQTRVKILKKYGNWDASDNLGQRLPYVKDSTLLLTTAGPLGDDSGTLVSSRDAVYLTNKMERPSGLRLWIREGTWKSCNQIKQNKKLPRQQSLLDDGPYMIKKTSHQYLPVICDMKSDKGAWTLLVTSASNGWRKSQVKHRNTNRPSLFRDYSILELGDQIKGYSGGNSFMYKLEANERGRWGGVWKAPKSYSFVAKNNKQTNVTLVKKYDEWQYNWASSLEKRMPWLGKRKGLLTTSTHADYSAWGTIVSEETVNNPAPWIDLLVNPGYIWYWVNEDDCGPKRTPVNGGLSSWSTWSACSPLCSVNGFQTRQRSCSNPVPRCGGRSCDDTDLIPEKRRCMHCPKSPIKGPRNLCIQPSTANCNPPENTKLVYKTNSNNCDQDYMVFLYDNDGMLMHFCSKKYVCPRGGKAGFGTPLVLSSFCKQNKASFEITKAKGLKHKKSGKCVHPNMGTPWDGIHLVTWTGCKGAKLKLDLFKLNDGFLYTTRPAKPTFTTPTRRVSSSRDSPVRSFGGFCWQPRTADCSPPEGTEIIYSGPGGNNVQCSQNYMRFTLTKNGRLKHTCSGKYLCPDPDYLYMDEALYNGIPVVLRNKCSDKRTKYTRTSAKSLRHSPSRFCIHAESGTPRSGTKAVFWNRCNVDRLKLDFYELRD